MAPSLFLYDDERARGWAPFALTRPVSELRFGGFTLSARSGRALGVAPAGILDTGGLAGFEEGGAPPVVSVEKIDGDALRVLLLSRYVPPLSDGAGRRALPLPAEGTRLRVGSTTVGWVLPPGEPAPPVDTLLSGDALPGLADLPVPGFVLDAPWELMARSSDQVTSDLAALAGTLSPLSPHPDIHRVGEHAVTAAEGVMVAGPVALDTRRGPIHLESGVHLDPFTRLVGPSWIGAGSSLLGGVFVEVSCGPQCRLRGEVEATVFLGYANKAHDGYLGHSVVGRWVNLGALTTNSDLKNNYGPVRVPTTIGEVDTGLLKVGTFLGDHAKTGIGTLLNTGTVVGAGSNLFGGTMPLKWVPPFSWGNGKAPAPFRKGDFLDLARQVMGRREVTLSDGMRDFLGRCWERARGGGEGDPA